MTDLIDPQKLKQIIEAALLAADEPLTVNRLTRLFAHGELDSEEGREQIRECLKTLEQEADGRGYELISVASGYRYQVRQNLAEWISRLWEERPPRYSRALLETLALVAYRQPVTRGDIEQVRGVAVSQSIMRTLLERDWIRVVGHREVPGRPAMYGTTRAFLDYFNLKSLDQLPPLSEITSLIEPLLIDEVIEEAVEVAEHDHPERFGPPGTKADTEADTEADGDPQPEADSEPADTVESGAESQTDAESQADADAQTDAEAEIHAVDEVIVESAEVVRLPTPSRSVPRG